jgi:hypothetical protein
MVTMKVYELLEYLHQYNLCDDIDIFKVENHQWDLYKITELEADAFKPQIFIKEFYKLDGNCPDNI